MEDIAWGTDAELTDKQFYNRKHEILLLKNLLETTGEGSSPTIMVSGIRGVGKTVLLKKIKKELEEDYLISYLDLTLTYSYQMGKLTEMGIMKHLYNSWMVECQNKNIFTGFKKISKYFKTKNFKLGEILDAGGIPLPILKSEDDYKKLSDFVLNMPQLLHAEHKDQIKGTILIIDEFQVLKDLGDRLDTFLWYMRSVVQNQKKVAYIFSGSLFSTDSLIEKIAGREGAFGGRMLNVEIHPFTKDTVRNYLKTKLPNLKFDESGLDRFYKCTKGIPFYVNTFAKLLDKNIYLNDEKVKKEFRRTLPLLGIHIVNLWSRLTLQEQKIVTCLVQKPLKRKEIAANLEVTSGSLSSPLKKLQDQGLIKLKEGFYKISEPILQDWIIKEYEEKGVYPFRSI